MTAIADPKISDLMALAREWANSRDNAVKMAGSGSLITVSGAGNMSPAQREFIQAQEQAMARLMLLMGPMSFYEWEAISEVFYMVKNSDLISKRNRITLAKG